MNRGMPPDEVVEHLDIIEHDLPCLITGFKFEVMQAFRFKCAEEISVHEGNVADSQTFMPEVQRLREDFGIGGGVQMVQKVTVCPLALARVCGEVLF